MAGYMINLFTKVEDPTPIHSWVMSSDISQEDTMAMRSQLLRLPRHAPHDVTYMYAYGANLLPTGVS